MEQLIPKQAAIDVVTDELDMIDHVPQWVFDRLEKRLKQLPPAQPKPNYDEWCTDCKEYDKEKHSCPRWNKVIKITVNELKSAQPEQHIDADGTLWITVPDIERVKRVIVDEDKSKFCRQFYMDAQPEQPEPCEDAVSRKAVKDGFVEMCSLNCPYTEKQRHIMCGSCLLGTAFDVLEATQPVTQKQRWTPVTERLPEDDTIVLVCGKSGGIYTAIHNNSKTWIRGWWKMNSKNHHCNPTAWMPLPKAYKNEWSDE